METDHVHGKVHTFNKPSCTAVAVVFK